MNNLQVEPFRYGGRRQVGRERWNQLNMQRRGFLDRTEGYASVTIPKVMLPDHVDQNSSSIQHDWSSVGAQAVNHLTNKILLTLFRPGAPFFRLDLEDEAMQALIAQAGVSEDDIREMLVAGEQKALRVLDRKAVRPRLNEAVRHLIVTGNVLLDLTDDNVRVIGLKNYTVKRTAKGKIVEILVYDRVLRDELEDDVQGMVKKQDDDYVEFVQQYRLRSGKWHLQQYIDDRHLGGFDHEWAEADFRLYPLTWDLADGQDYGTGLVEDYAGDFGSLSTLSEAELKLALQLSDYRWLASPSGVTDVEEFRRSRAGDVISGREGDVALVNAGNMGQSLQYVSASTDKVIRRIGSAFLLGSAVTRDAERVTAEEVRMQAQELETSLGGVYSRLAVDMQLPLSVWLLEQVNISIKGTKLEPTVITGLDALSRNAEAQQLRMFLSDVSQVGTLPDDVRMRLKLSDVIATLAAANGIVSKKYVMTEDEFAAAQQAAQQQMQETEAQTEVTKAGAQALAKGPTQ